MIQGSGLRGFIPGLWTPPHSLTTLTAAFADGDTLTVGTRTFMMSTVAQSGMVAIEISSTW